MGILVCYDDFTYDVINDTHLDCLVEAGCVIGYDKSGVWVKTETFAWPNSDFVKEDRRPALYVKQGGTD